MGRIIFSLRIKKPENFVIHFSAISSFWKMFIRWENELGISFFELVSYTFWGLPRWHSHKESACQCRRHKRHRFDPWVRKIPLRKKRQPTPVGFLAWKIPWTEEPGGIQFHGVTESNKTGYPHTLVAIRQFHLVKVSIFLAPILESELFSSSSDSC